MSLFQAREWWSTWAGNDEEFDGKGLCVANVDNGPRGHDKIVIGSYNGILRIFAPSPPSFRPENLMLEMHLQQPILQVECGRFVSGSDAFHLAVLHPRKVAIHSVSAVSGSVEHGNHYMLTLMHEHILERTSYSMVCGAFGGVKGKDFICVQSMDGVLSCFEQETFSFATFLPNFLLPGPLAYMPSSDSIVTCSSKRMIESYKYQVLAVAAGDPQSRESKSGKMLSGKKLTPDWSTNIGEFALTIQCFNFSGATAGVMVLGERAMFCLKSNGMVRFAKKFDFNPSCFLSYSCGGDDKIKTMVGTHTKSLLIYEDVTLIWAAQLPEIASRCLIGNFQDLNGVIVTVDEFGHVYCSYLGTDPSLFVAPAVEAREINYDQLDEEMAQLNAIIKASQTGEDLASISQMREEISIFVTIPPDLDEIPYTRDDGEDHEDMEQYPSITVKVTLRCESSTPIENVSVQCLSAFPILCNQPSILLPIIGSKSPTTDLTVTFFSGGGALPSSLAATVSATYSTSSEAPRVAQCRFDLPLELICYSCAPVKQANFKLTLETNQDPVNLGEMFPEMVEDSVIPVAAMAFQYYGGPIVTILSSKSSQRYRLQCDVFEGVWLILSEQLKRMERHFSTKGGTPFKAGFAGPLPMTDYLELIEAHFEHRLNYQNYRQILAERAKQFRVIQKRLLTKFKDKTPSPLMNLEILLDGTYQQLLALGDACEEAQRAMKHAGNRLSSGTRLINLLAKLWTGMSQEEYETLEAVLSPVVMDTDDQGWEETTDAAVHHLLRTCLSKSGKDQSSGVTEMKMLTDTLKLRKHINLVFDRLAKGAKLHVRSSKSQHAKPAGKENNSNSQSKDVTDGKQSIMDDTSPLNRTHMFDGGSMDANHVETAVQQVLAE